MAKAGWNVESWREEVGSISLRAVWRLIYSGEIVTAKIGRRRIILTSPREFLARNRDTTLLGEL